MLLAEEPFQLDPAQFLLVSVDLPVDARVTEASTAKPYVGLRISLDPKVVGELLADGTDVASAGSSERGLGMTPVEPQLLDAVTRLVDLLDSLQYQKRMRLQEARSLMLGERLAAAEAAFRVGYESPSQFSREYRRMFGSPPRQDVDAVLAETS